MRRLLSSLLLCALAPSLTLLAQGSRTASKEVDVAATYGASRGSGTNGATFWAQGVSAELSAALYHGFGAALVVSYHRASDIGGTTVNLSTVNVVAGPRYTLRRRKLAVYGEALFGDADGFDSVYPAPGGSVSSANSLAVQLGGGVDLRVSEHLALRALDASWLRTQFPNGAGNLQNSLQLGAGIVFRLR